MDFGLSKFLQNNEIQVNNNISKVEVHLFSEK